MKSFLLLIISLMAGREALSAVKGCIDGWAEFTCNQTKPKGKEKAKRFHWHSDERNGHFKLFTEELTKQQDAVEYSCKCENRKHNAVTQTLSEKCCLKPFHQTKSPSAKISIACYVQKSTKSTGSRSDGGAHQSAKINFKLEVQKIRFFTRSLTVGQNLSYWCDYKSHTADKFICKGEDPSTCKRVASTAQNKSDNGKFFLSDDEKKKNITITVTDVTREDAGTYWCGAQTYPPMCGDVFFHRFIMTVVGSPSTEAPATSPVPSSQTTTESAANSHGGVSIITHVIICVAVLLLFVLIFIYIYKRLSRSKTTRNGEPQSVREDYVYEEIQELRQRPETRNAMNSIYVTANFPTNHSASLHYSTIKFHKAGGETPKPSSSGCEYSTVKLTQSPKTVIHPSPSTDDPLYSTVNKPQPTKQTKIIRPDPGNPDIQI